MKRSRPTMPLEDVNEEFGAESVKTFSHASWLDKRERICSKIVVKKAECELYNIGDKEKPLLQFGKTFF